MRCILDYRTGDVEYCSTPYKNGGHILRACKISILTMYYVLFVFPNNVKLIEMQNKRKVGFEKKIYFIEVTHKSQKNCNVKPKYYFYQLFSKKNQLNSL